VSLVFLAAPVLLAERAHVAVDFVARSLPPPARDLVARVALALVALFCAIFLVAGWRFMAGAWRFATPALGIPNWVFYAPVLLGVLLMGCVAIGDLARPGSPAAEERDER
jgi:TRAP-type C4-dicarboxylate transport system permease small subunit